jgi:uncharacterized protein (TIGR02145 family)
MKNNNFVVIVIFLSVILSNCGSIKPISSGRSTVIITTNIRQSEISDKNKVVITNLKGESVLYSKTEIDYNKFNEYGFLKNEFSKKRRTLIVSHPYYKSGTIVINRTLRPVVFTLDLLGAFTIYLSPSLIIDFSNGNIWKVKKSNREINVNLEYNDSKIHTVENRKTNKVIAYETIKIGTQVWTTKNLDVSTFRNGDEIPQVTSTEEWESATRNNKPAWCYYKNDPANGTKYGKLYNWYAVSDPRGLAPIGYHIPTIQEWTILTDFLGGALATVTSADAAGGKMKSTSDWEGKGNRTNTSGFSALPGGFRGQYGEFLNAGYSGKWWSSTEEYVHTAKNIYLSYANQIVDFNYSGKKDGLSVRCLKD